MANLAFVLIAHEPADVVGQSIDMLLAADAMGTVVVHYDRNSPKNAFDALKGKYGGHDRVLLVEDRVRCGWGQFGLVEGTIRALRLLRERRVSYTHAYLVSCSCWPLRPLAELRQFLDRQAGVDFIESHDETWMTGGLREERYTRHHPFSFTRQRWLFEASVALQRKLGIRRRIPSGLKPRYGSQWWCLRRETVEKVLDWIEGNPAAYRFYRTVWIPDETFFQTILHALGETPAAGYIPTLYTFNAHGKPIVFYDDHLDWLQKQPHFFARKVAQSAEHCRRTLLARACLPEPPGDAILATPATGARKIPAARQRPRYGQIFEPGSGVRNWPKNLEMMGCRGAVLYGPPQLTRRAGEVLGAAPGLTVLGRLFQPDRIAFQPGSSDFQGLRAGDVKLRDYDRALYLSRVLSRCARFPVFELCPGDDPILEKSLLDGENLIVLPLLPGGRRPPWRFLFWYLALPEAERARIDAGQDWHDRLARVQAVAGQYFGGKYVVSLERRLFTCPSAVDGIVFSDAHEAVDPEWKAALRFLHGAPAEPLLSALDTLAKAFSGQDWHGFCPWLVPGVGKQVERHG